VPIGIGQMAASHFTTLKTLGEVLPKEHIKTVHTGGPGQRLMALLDGEVEVANLLVPLELANPGEEIMRISKLSSSRCWS
jgi:hypothetical protein